VQASIDVDVKMPNVSFRMQGTRDRLVLSDQPRAGNGCFTASSVAAVRRTRTCLPIFFAHLRSLPRERFSLGVFLSFPAGSTNRSVMMKSIDRNVLLRQLRHALVLAAITLCASAAHAADADPHSVRESFAESLRSNGADYNLGLFPAALPSIPDALGADDVPLVPPAPMQDGRGLLEEGGSNAIVEQSKAAQQFAGLARRGHERGWGPEGGWGAGGGSLPDGWWDDHLGCGTSCVTPTSAVPEPESAGLVGAGLIAILAGMARRRRGHANAGSGIEDRREDPAPTAR
jgi:hypothetical protein